MTTSVLTDVFHRIVFLVSISSAHFMGDGYAFLLLKYSILARE